MKITELSIFKKVLNTVSKIPFFHKSGQDSLSAQHENMQPGKGFKKNVDNIAPEYLRELNDDEFDNLIALIFKQRGYKVDNKENIQNELVDMVLRQDGDISYVQLRHWKEKEIDEGVVEVFSAAMKESKVKSGIILTSGEFTAEALDFALGKALLLINGVDLSLMITAINVPENEAVLEIIDEEEPEDEESPACPLCGNEMIKRKAKKGRNAGNSFWGCSQFPDCRGIV